MDAQLRKWLDEYFEEESDNQGFDSRMASEEFVAFAALDLLVSDQARRITELEAWLNCIASHLGLDSGNYQNLGLMCDAIAISIDRIGEEGNKEFYAAMELLKEKNERISKLEARLKTADKRLDIILSQCFIRNGASIALPCGYGNITDDDKQDSLRQLDKAIQSLEGKE